MRIFDVLQIRGYQTQFETQKRSPLRVGTDIMPIREAEKAEPKRDTISIEDNAKIAQDASARFTQTHGSSVKSFESNGYQVSVSAGSGDGVNTMIFSKEGQDDIVLNFKGDARLTFDSNGAPRIEEVGAGADKLAATANNQILIRTGDRDVDTGNYSTTVMNVSSKAGTFTSGAGKTTFLGSYTGSTINGGNGSNDFAGTFQDCQINGGNGQNDFSGMFSGSVVNGGMSADLFTGIFLNMSMLNGGAGNDSFTGTFFDSTVDGGAGDDVYGKIRLADARERGKKWDGFVADVNFWNTTITDSEGNDTLEAVVKGGSIDLGSGDDTLSGAFVETSVTAGAGNNIINAFYADTANFLGGDGNDTIKVATGINTRVQAGSGESAVSMGVTESEAAGWEFGVEGGGVVSMGGKHWGRGVRRNFDYESKDFGYQSGSFVDAGEGETVVNITIDGITTTLDSMEILKEEKAEKEEEAAAAEASEKKLIDNDGTETSTASNGSAPVSESVYTAGKAEPSATPSNQTVNVEQSAMADEESVMPELSLEERVAALIQSSSEKGYSTEFEGAMVSFGEDYIFNFSGSTERSHNFKWLNKEEADWATRRRGLSAYGM